MIRILQSLLALISLLVMAFVAARADSATLRGCDSYVEPAPDEGLAALPTRRPLIHRCLVPAPPPGTHLQRRPFAYGYFGAHPQTSAVVHSNNRSDWFQWSFYRAD